jgi:predicted SAM-dependent methyltransferase
MRLNLGCGNRKNPEWVNVDKVPDCQPDVLADLEKFPWPWETSSVDEVLMSHVLEHLGATTDLYFGIMKELYRVCRNGAKITIIVPHPRHNNFLSDPTHVRPITEHGLNMFSQESNRRLMAAGAANTPLGIYLGIDFKIEAVEPYLDEQWANRAQLQKLTNAQIEEAARLYNNVIEQITVTMRAVKPS